MPEALVTQVVTFGRALREAGLEVGPARLSDALVALDAVGMSRRHDVYWALRTTLVARHEDLEVFDRVFGAWFLGAEMQPLPSGAESETFRARTDGEEREGELDGPGWSAEEVLRRKDFAAMTEGELARARALMAELARSRPVRRSRRLRPHRRGVDVDLRRLARASLATGGDPLARAFRRRTEAPRKLVVLCDVSGSMEPYTRAMLLFLHAVVGSGPRVEVFAFGTRLTRLTPELETRDPDRALAEAAERAVDWASGTRIGASLKTFNDLWGRRAVTRGAAVVIVSDGWEREDPALVGREMARLARAAYAVVWVNPLKGHPDYQPLAGGMRAALPYVDRFLSGHNLVSLEQLAGVLAGLERRHAA